LREAVEEYSTVNPRNKTAVLTGDGVLTTFPLPAGWVDGFSTLDSIEYPIGNQEPVFLDEAEEYTADYWDATGGPKIHFYSLVLGLSVTALVKYTALHHVLSQNPVGETTADTIPIKDRYGVASLAAANCCLMLAAYYAQTSDSTIGADAVDYGSRTERYLALARQYRGEYNGAFGIAGDSGVMAASAHMDLDTTPSWGWDRFFHSRLNR
jgi:hypothetical protein